MASNTDFWCLFGFVVGFVVVFKGGVFSPSKALEPQSSCRWFETPRIWLQCNDISGTMYSPACLFSALSKHHLAIECHFHILQVSSQLSCGDTRQIKMWFKESNRYFCKMKHCLIERVTNVALESPAPVLTTMWSIVYLTKHCLRSSFL